MLEEMKKKDAEEKARLLEEQKKKDEEEKACLLEEQKKKDEEEKARLLEEQKKRDEDAKKNDAGPSNNAEGSGENSFDISLQASTPSSKNK